MSGSRDLRPALDRASEIWNRRPLEPSGGPPHDGDMEARVARLEDDVKDVRKDMKEVLSRLARLEGLVGQLPTTWVMLTAIIGSMIALLGFVFIILRYATST